MKAIFVAGTDTGVGKTVVTGLLARYMSLKGHSAVTQKWAGSGSRSDVGAHIRSMGKRPRDFREIRASMEPYRFAFAASAHLAARLEGRRVDPDRIKRSFRGLSRRFDVVIAEGLGGLLVPLRSDTLTVDIVKELDLPVVLVAANKLGAINHTLLSLEALRARKIDVIGVVFNNAVPEKEAIREDNPRIIKKLGEVNLLGVLPYARDTRTLDRHFKIIGRRIERYYE